MPHITSGLTELLKRAERDALAQAKAEIPIGEIVEALLLAKNTIAAERKKNAEILQELSALREATSNTSLGEIEEERNYWFKHSLYLTQQILNNTAGAHARG